MRSPIKIRFGGYCWPPIAVVGIQLGTSDEIPLYRNAWEIRRPRGLAFSIRVLSFIQARLNGEKHPFFWNHVSYNEFTPSVQSLEQDTYETLQNKGKGAAR